MRKIIDEKPLLPVIIYIRQIMKHLIVLLFFPLLLFVSCGQKRAEPETQKPRLVFHFELDTAGNITDTLVKRELGELGIRINANADRVVIYSYTEKMGNPDECVALAKQRADAAKDVMFKAAGERVYYNVGIEARGCESPVDKTNPVSMVNRRIEIEYLQ